MTSISAMRDDDAENSSETDTKSVSKKVTLGLQFKKVFWTSNQSKIILDWLSISKHSLIIKALRDSIANGLNWIDLDKLDLREMEEFLFGYSDMDLEVLDFQLVYHPKRMLLWKKSDRNSVGTLYYNQCTNNIDRAFDLCGIKLLNHWKWSKSGSKDYGAYQIDLDTCQTLLGEYYNMVLVDRKEEFIQYLDTQDVNLVQEASSIIMCIKP